MCGDTNAAKNKGKNSDYKGQGGARSPPSGIQSDVLLTAFVVMAEQ